jgi:polysaccharide biosynthesis protein PslH
MDRPRAVFVTPIEPALTGSGLAMRMGLFLSALSAFASVDVILAPVVASAGAPPGRSLTEAVGARLHVIPTHDFIDTRYALLMRIPDQQARLAAFRAYARPSLARALSPGVMDRIEQIIRSCRPDILHIGRSYLSEIVTLAPTGAIVTLDLDEDDLANHLSQAALARKSGRIIEAEWLAQEGRACDALVARFGPNCHHLFVASDREARLLAPRHPGLRFTRVENAIEIPRPTPRRDDGATLVFVGALGYQPNSKGLLWFASEVLPRLKARRAAVPRLLIAGASAPREVTALSRDPRIRLLGRVDDLAALYRQATLALAPMSSGGGTRIKLVEAAAHGVASVSTQAAADGLDWPADVGGWRASSASGFAAACDAGLSDAGERARRAMAAKRRVIGRQSRDRVIASLAGALKGALSLR